jgi:uncharacterized coiled-coil DUF342 family protein
MPKVRMVGPWPVYSRKDTPVSVRDMTRYEEAVDELIEELEGISDDMTKKNTKDELYAEIESYRECLVDLRALADAVRFEFQMMQIERKECIRPTTLA